MKKLAFSPSQARYGLALVVGLVQAAAFPKIGLSWLAWLVPGLLLALSVNQKGSTVFRIGYYAGLAHYLASLYSLLLIPLPVHAIAAWLAVAALLALYTAAWNWFCWKISPLNSTTLRTSAK